MMKSGSVFFAGAIVSAVMLMGCSSSNSISALDYAPNYRSQERLMEPQLSIQHVNDSISLLHYSLRSSDLLYRRAAGTDTFRCEVQIELALHKSYSATVPYWRDTLHFSHGSVTLNDTAFFGSFSFPFLTGDEAVLQVDITDEIRGYSYRAPVFCEKRNPDSRQWFGLYGEDGNRLFSPYIRSGSRVRVTHPASENFVVYGYQRSFPMPAPPYAVDNPMRFDYTPDTVFAWTSGDYLELPDSGFYHIQTDTNNAYGLTLYGSHRAFPYLTDVAQLRPALQYISTREEFTALMSENERQGLKKIVDAFWLSRSSSPDRARVLIRTYYGRVEEANSYFSSYQPGWKTDRGMIFILFGPPNSLLKLDEGEVWVYGDQNNLSSYNFNFVRVENPFTENDLELNRSTIYRYSWSQAVDLWRSGRVFNVNEIQRAQNDLQRQLMRPYFWY